MIQDQYLLSCEILKDKITDNNNYPFNLPVVKNIENISLHKNVTFLVGENGTGKSTLLEALAINYGFNPEGGSRNFNFATKETHSPLSEVIRIAKGIKKAQDGFFLRAESFYNVASNIDKLNQESHGQMYGDYGGKSLHEQSHGESFWTLFMERFGGNGVYMLDEPEAALSPQRQLAFLVRMHELVQQKSQFIIATHSPIILSYPHAKVIQISEDSIEEISYQESEHFAIYKTFFDNPALILKNLEIEDI